MCGGKSYSRLVTRQRMARHEKEVIKELTQLIKTKGDAILSGDCKLSLTSVSLSILNEKFKRLLEEDVSINTDRAKHSEDTRFLYDFLQRITSLKVIHGSSTIQGQVRLQQFKNLQCLEVKKVPVHLLEGLHYLRPQLKVLIASRCLQNLHDLFETCGGDMSSSQSWPLLKTACLSSNNLEDLDGSLRLLPSLETLDLSFNQMVTTDGYLEYLTELLHVNLAYNRLEVIPTFALRVRHQLRTLILRNNNLDSMEGIQELTELRDVDLSHNCFCDHSKLHQLCYLHNLKNLNLRANPLSYHPQHRQLSIQYFSPLAARLADQGKHQISLDGKPLSNIEILYIPKNPVHYRKGSFMPSAFADIHSRVNHQLRGSARNSPQNLEESEGELSASYSSRGRKGKKRARKAKISDFEDSAEFTSRETSRATSPRLPDQDTSSLKNGMDSGMSREEIEATRKQLGPGWLVSLTARQEYLSLDQKQGQDSTPLQTSVRPNDDYYLNDDTVTGSDVEQDDGIIIIIPERKEEKVEESQVEEKKGSELLVQRSTSSGMEWGEADKEQEEVVEGEPFIVNLSDDDNTQIIVIIGEKFLWEKDITGDIMEKLDLKLLQAVDRLETPSNQYAVKLSFDYLRKDRQSRLYNLEDKEQLEGFCDHLVEHVEARQEARKYKDLLQCLKCETHFHKLQSLDGTEKFQFSEDGKVKEAGYKCPQCQSTMVVELDAAQIAQARGVGAETPVGSVKSLDTKIPLASSSLNSTPMKIGAEVQNESRDTDSFKSCPGTYSSFKSVGDTTPNFQSPKKGNDSDGPKYVTADTNLRNNSSSFSDTFQIAKNSPSGVGSLAHCFTKSGQDLQEITRNSSVPTNLALVRSETSVGSSPKPIISFPGKPHSAARQRIDSGESDITVISNPSQSSIAVLTNPSQEVTELGDQTLIYNSGLRNKVTMSPVSGRSLSMDEGAELMKQFTNRDTSSPCEDSGTEGTPHGSLTTKTVSSMIDSVYEYTKRTDEAQSSNASPLDSIDGQNIYNGPQDTDVSLHVNNVNSVNCDKLITDAGQPSFTSYIEPNLDPQKASANSGAEQASFTSYIEPKSDSKDTSLTKKSSPDEIVYNYEDYSQVDHRLKLWLAMHLLEDNQECHALLRCGVVQYMMDEEYPALLIATDKKIYIIKITGKERDDPAKWLKCTESQPITELQFVDIGYNYQCFRLEFGTDFSSYTCLVRDQRRCKLFIAMFTAVVQSGSLSTHSKLEGITKNFTETLDHLREQVLLLSEPEDSFSEDDLEIREFVAGFLHDHDDKEENTSTKSGVHQGKAVTIITTKALICLAVQNYQWPLPRLQGPVSEDVKKTEFTLVDKKHINEIAQVNLSVENPTLLTLEFFEDESEDAELSCWEITVETEESLASLVDSIKEPWEAAFNVPLTIVKLCSNGES